MSHHFDTETARQDPRLNLNDLYLFAGSPGRVTMVMSVNPHTGDAPSELLHPEGVYAFEFDLDGDFRADVLFSFRVRSDGRFEVRRVRADGETTELLVGRSDVVERDSGGQVEAFVGVRSDPFAGNAEGLGVFLQSFADGRFADSAFANRRNFFANWNVVTLALEVPTGFVGDGQVHAWGSISLEGHAPKQQIARWGLPLITHLFITDPSDQDKFNRSLPAEDGDVALPAIRRTAAGLTTLAGTAPSPEAYAERLATRLCPVVLPYRLGTTAGFDHSGFNGRAPGDDVMDVMLTLSANSPISGGARPDTSRMTKEFPYLAPVGRTPEQR